MHFQLIIYINKQIFYLEFFNFILIYLKFIAIIAEILIDP